MIGYIGVLYRNRMSRPACSGLWRGVQSAERPLVARGSRRASRGSVDETSALELPSGQNRPGCCPSTRPSRYRGVSGFPVETGVCAAAAMSRLRPSAPPARARCMASQDSSRLSAPHGMASVQWRGMPSTCGAVPAARVRHRGTDMRRRAKRVVPADVPATLFRRLQNKELRLLMF